MAKRTEWVRVKVVSGMAEAELWRTLLAEEGVDAFIQPNDASPYLGPSSFCYLLVSAGDAKHATDLITAWGEESVTDGADQSEA